MSMSIGGGGEDEPMMEMNMTPLIDVLLVLLVMFIITIPVMTHAVKLDMPRPTNAAQQSDPVVINLEIDFDGTVLWNGVNVGPIVGFNVNYINNASLKSAGFDFALNNTQDLGNFGALRSSILASYQSKYELNGRDLYISDELFPGSVAGDSLLHF